MDKWNSISDEELMNSCEYVEKLNMDDCEVENSPRDFTRKKRENSWVRKDKYRKETKRRFLSGYPGLDFDASFPLDSTENTTFLNDCFATDERYYSINPVNHLFKTKRGYIDTYRGNVKWIRCGMFWEITAKNPYEDKLMNRRIRYEKFDAEGQDACRYSALKKKYSFSA